MKENRKLLREVLKDIRHDMTDEEVLNLLADSKISESPATEKYTLGQRAADAIAKFPKIPRVRRKNTPLASARQTPSRNLRAAGCSSSPSPAY